MPPGLLLTPGRLGLRVESRQYPDAASESRGGTVALMVPEAPLVARALKARDFLVDYRVGAGIRISPHFYNTFEELDRLMAEIVRIVRTRDYDPSAPSTSLVT